jgi:hypothetical protein
LHSGINAEIVRTGLRVLLYAADYAYKASDCMDTDHHNHDLATSICPKKIWAICRDWWQFNFTAFEYTETMGFGVPFIRGKSENRLDLARIRPILTIQGEQLLVLN